MAVVKVGGVLVLVLHRRVRVRVRVLAGDRGDVHVVVVAVVMTVGVIVDQRFVAMAMPVAFGQVKRDAHAEQRRRRQDRR